jgi:hypothetical protein
MVSRLTEAATLLRAQIDYAYPSDRDQIRATADLLDAIAADSNAHPDDSAVDAAAFALAEVILT